MWNEYLVNDSDAVAAADFAVTSDNVTAAAGHVTGRYPREATLFAAACAIFFVVIGVVGNAVTLAALSRSPRLRGHATTTFVISLCASDLLFCAVNLPLTAARFLHARAPLPDRLCWLFPLLFYGNEAVSLLSMVAVTINRYVLIAFYPHYARLYTPTSIRLQLAAIWLVSFGLLLPPAVGAWGRLGLDERTFSCTILRDDAGRSPKTFLFVVGFALPCFVIAGCYTCIYCTVRSSKRRLGADDDSRLTALMASIFVAFLACFLPLMCMNVADDAVRYPWLHIVASALAWASSVCNPLIYAATNRQYRAAYRHLLRPRRRGGERGAPPPPSLTQG